MKVTCDYCGMSFNKKPSDIKNKNYCCRACWRKANTVITKCENCNKEVVRCKSQILEHVFCCRTCAKKYLSSKMQKMNAELNPTRMTPETRTKLRIANLGKGEGRTYTKTFGRHTHRIAAERLLGRPLKEGEVVHHIDGNKRNNDPFNLMVFKSQTEHALWHKNEKLDPSKNYE